MIKAEVATYTYIVTPTAEGSVTTSIAAGVATDSNNNTKTASNSLVTTYDKTLVSDTFTGTNGDNINGRTPDTVNIPGNNWEILSGVADIQSNKASTTSSSLLLAVIESSETDVDFNVDVTIGAGSAVAVIARVKDASNYWLIEIYTGWSDIRLREVTADVFTDRATTAITTPADGSTHTLRVTVDAANQFNVYYDGDLKITHTSSVHATETKHGLFSVLANSVKTFDNFQLKKV